MRSSGESVWKRRDRERQARDHARLPRDQDRMRLGRLRDGRHRGDVAGAAEVFVERALHGRIDRKRRQEGVRVKQRGWCGHDGSIGQAIIGCASRAGASSVSCSAIARAFASVVIVRWASAGISAG